MGFARKNGIREDTDGVARTRLGRYFVPGWESRRPCLGIFCTCLGIWGLLLGILVYPPGAGSSYRGKSDLVTMVTFESYRSK